MRRILWVLVPALVLVCVASAATQTLHADVIGYMDNAPYGYEPNVGVPFADLVGASTTLDEYVYTGAGFTARIDSAELDTGNYTIESRGYAMFPAAGLPAGYTITGAKIGIYPNEEAVDGFGMSFTIVSFTPGAEITGADYGNIGSTHFITDTPVAGSLTLGQYTNLSLNAEGIAAISNTAANGFAIVLVPTEPEWIGATQEIMPLDASITPETPIFLEIEYTAPEPEPTPAPTAATGDCGTWSTDTSGAESIMGLLGFAAVIAGLSTTFYSLKMMTKPNPQLTMAGLAATALGVAIVVVVLIMIPGIGGVIEGMC